jgi:DNA mismatch repair protein MutL
VVERPAAVVKELIENSLMRRARPFVEIKDGGLASIRVTDDGEGMSRADAPQAFERHATSKLRSDQDYGPFVDGISREALPSIASVSNAARHGHAVGSGGYRVADAEERPRRSLMLLRLSGHA